MTLKTLFHIFTAPRGGPVVIIPLHAICAAVR